MSNGLQRWSSWRPGQRNGVSSPPLYGMSRPWSWQAGPSYGASGLDSTDWEYGDYLNSGGFMMDPWLPIQERRMAGPYTWARFPVLGGDHMANNNYQRLRQPVSESAQMFLGQFSRQVPRQEEESRLTKEEQNKALSRLRKETYYPKTTVRSLARRLSSYYRDKAKASSGEMDREEDDEDGKRCSVCLDDFRPRETVMLTPCSHMFHEDCILPWLRSNSQCPVCRAVIYKPRNERGPPRISNQPAALDPLELISLVRAMEESMGWG